jgi:hypothetical protein
MDVDDPADGSYLAGRDTRAVSQHTGSCELGFRLTI